MQLGQGRAVQAWAAQACLGAPQPRLPCGILLAGRGAGQSVRCAAHPRPTPASSPAQVEPIHPGHALAPAVDGEEGVGRVAASLVLGPPHVQQAPALTCSGPGCV